MLFNTLANLRSLIGHDPAQAQHMVDQLVRFLRNGLVSSRQPLHSIEQEFAALDSYLQLMRIRMGERLQYEFELPAVLAAHPIPSLILQPLVENSIRHGLEPQIEGGLIRIRAMVEPVNSAGKRLTLCVQDSGLGFDTLAHTSTSYGLAHVRERLQVLYGDQAELRVHSPLGQATQVCIDLPYSPTPTSTP
jgi:sensor histidine kinase YesM